MALYASVPAISPVPLRYRLFGSYSLSLVCSVPLPVGLAGFAGMGSISASGASMVCTTITGLISVREMNGIRGMRIHFRLMSNCQLIFMVCFHVNANAVKMTNGYDDDAEGSFYPKSVITQV